MPKRREQKKYIWITRVFMHTRVPTVDLYELIEVHKNGWKVNSWGRPKIIRKALEVRVFFEEAKLRAFLIAHLAQQIAIRQREIAEMRKALRQGVAVHKVPTEQPVGHANPLRLED